MPQVLVPLADGVEEMEAVIIVDILRRAGWRVVTAALQEGPVAASRGVRLVPDQLWDALDPQAFDVLMLPGGAGGAARLAADERVLATIREFARAGKWIGAVCAAPLVLQAAGILAGRRVTCHPTVAAKLNSAPRLPARVVVDGRLVTSQGAGTTFEFALKLVALIEGEDKAQAIAQAIVL